MAGAQAAGLKRVAVRVHSSADLPRDGWDQWCAVGGAVPNLDPARRLPDLARRLEAAFDSGMPLLRDLARELSAGLGSQLAHAPACSTNVSDLGVMIAWSLLVTEAAVAPGTLLVVCDDPWFLRHCASIRGVAVGRLPTLWPTEVRLALRGLAARARVVAVSAWAALSGKAATPVEQGGAWLLSYCHPASTADGQDAYFGPLMRELPHLTRALHVDCPPDRARELAGDGRSTSLHGFGSPVHALGLWRARWQPRFQGPWRWLVRGAAAREGGTGTGAAIAWQDHCQTRWLHAARPRVVAWPWENHSWERLLVRRCRELGIPTVGYQHATVARRELNYVPTAETQLPDRILTVGEADRLRLVGFGCPPERLTVAGALRYSGAHMPVHDPAAPIFVALPFDGAIAVEMASVIRSLAGGGRSFLLRAHPMAPLALAPGEGFSPDAPPLNRLERVAGVIHCATTVGLEALLAGLPVLRFLPRARPVVDVAPDGIVFAAATADELADALDNWGSPLPVDPFWVFAQPDLAAWAEALA